MRFYPSVIKYVQRVNEDDPEEIKEFMDGFGIAHEGEIVDGEYGNWDGDSPPRDESHPIAHLTVRKGVVERVILYGHGLTKVPESLQRFPCLLSLNLSNNKIDRIPKWMENIFYLRRLNLSSNCISEIPHWVLNYRWLEDLYLHHNEITELPPGMQFMCMLDVLNVSYNQLKEIPIDQKGKSPSLSHTLHEFHVPFDMAKKSLEKTFWEEESPVEHYYYNVKMDELFRSCHYVRRWNYFYKRKFIRHLWARGNHISEIPKRGSSMKTINFLDNPIRDIPEIYKSRDCKLKFKATVRGIDYE
ncbi:MAG TPA: leucine-rich repeat domain-containing protein, partial [Patescibacteria group bacterium]|nr:leucine-rich repeat domain-containing protein [Patescibacteria group bacterium]